jgi:polar amino acid transport system substrate-binding protein
MRMLPIAAALGLATAAAVPAAGQEACASYVVQRGDTLRAITQRAYGDDRFQRVYEANREVIGPSPDLIEVGITLRLPCRDGTLPGASPAAATEAPAPPEPGSAQALPQPAKAAVPPANAPADGGPLAALPSPAGPAPDTIRFLTAGGLPPFADLAQPGLGLAAELIARVMETTAPDRTFAIATAPDAAAVLEDLLPRGAGDLGFAWFRPVCPAPAAAPARVRRLCESYAFSAPLAELDVVLLVRQPEGTAALAARPACVAAGYVGPDPLADGLLPEGTAIARGSAEACLAGLAGGSYGAVLANPELTGPPPAGIVAARGLAARQALVAIAPRANAEAMARLALFDRGLVRTLDGEEWPALVAAALADWRARQLD